MKLSQPNNLYLNKTQVIQRQPSFIRTDSFLLSPNPKKGLLTFDSQDFFRTFFAAISTKYVHSANIGCEEPLEKMSVYFGIFTSLQRQFLACLRLFYTTFTCLFFYQNSSCFRSVLLAFLWIKVALPALCLFTLFSNYFLKMPISLGTRVH